ncbi:hypothetical protein [Bacillus sp. AFS041924]|uniref:hypothetical protein n=1 Tax=Bacillus sp. AFS041924 TaxID=2033503 RepID=UPI000BFE085E|nr:hypothetical protein [Bacillus sp. AFS041924]PGS52262.1 hypothetical protein COC46_10230 [Bacillus sp. AFS041924]
MNFQFHFDEYHLASDIIITLVNYITLGYLFYWVYKTNTLKPKVWKALIAMLIGIFVFSINLNFDHYRIEIPILPLGLWILYWICKRNDHQDRWGKYRRFAWAGFLIRFFFLITSLLKTLIDSVIY